MSEVSSLRQELRGLRESQQAQAARLTVFMDTTSTLISALQAQLTRLLTGHAPPHGLLSGPPATDIAQGSGTPWAMDNSPAFGISHTAASHPRIAQPSLSFSAISHPASQVMPGQTGRAHDEVSSRPGPALMATLRQPALMQSKPAHAEMGSWLQMNNGSVLRGSNKAADPNDSGHGSLPAPAHETPATFDEAGGWDRASLPGSSADGKPRAAARQQSCSQSWAQQAWPATCLSSQAGPEARLQMLASQKASPAYQSSPQVRVNPQMLMHACSSGGSQVYQPANVFASANGFRLIDGSHREPTALHRPQQHRPQAEGGKCAEDTRQPSRPEVPSTQPEVNPLTYPAVQLLNQPSDPATARFTADSQHASQQEETRQHRQPEYQSHQVAADQQPCISSAVNMAKQGLAQVPATARGPAHLPASADQLFSQGSWVLSYAHDPSNQHTSPEPGFKQLAWGDEYPLAVAEAASSPQQSSEAHSWCATILRTNFRCARVKL